MLISPQAASIGRALAVAVAGYGGREYAFCVVGPRAPYFAFNSHRLASESVSGPTGPLCFCLSGLLGKHVGEWSRLV